MPTLSNVGVAVSCLCTYDMNISQHTHSTVFTAISLIGAALAVIMKERAKQVYITCGILFSAGVLLAAGFVHMLNDSNEDFLDAGVDNFPWLVLFY